MADEAITWPAPPDDTNETDGAQSYNMGRIFTLTEDAPVVGVEWRVPDAPLTNAPAGGSYGIALWDVTGNTRLAFKTVTPTPGGPQQFLFDEGDFHDGLTSETLLASIYTNHYVYATGDDAGATSPSGTIVAGGSRLSDNNGGAAGAPIPTNVTTLNFYVSPVVRLADEPEDHITSGTAAVAVTVTATSSTARATSGTVAAAAAASATTTTSRTTSGTAAASVAATATSGTARVTADTARVTATLTASAATVRATSGVAAVAVTLGEYTASSGVAAPRLVSRRQQGRIVSRTRVTSG